MLEGNEHPAWLNYEPWVRRRMDVIVAHYGAEFFAGKRVVDLGAGHGGAGGALLELGAKVTFVEGREIHADYLRTRYPDCETILMNLDTGWPAEEYDFALFMGLLYHLADPVRAIGNCTKYADLVLESEVEDNTDECHEPQETGEGPGEDQALEGVRGKHPSVFWLERELSKNGLASERFIGGSCNYGNHHYDWKPLDLAHEPGRRAMWFCRREGARC